MAYEADVLEVMIASPSDVADEREIVRQIITEWNVLNSRDKHVVLMPIGWETHSAPDLSSRPQQLINDRVLAHADLLVGIFWTKLGSPTGKAASGTVEEIEEHLAKSKPVMLYFSNAPAVPSSINAEQYEKLNEFKRWAYGKGLVQSYDTKDIFRDDFRRHLSLTASRIIERDTPDFVQLFEQELGQALSSDAADMLRLQFRISMAQ